MSCGINIFNKPFSNQELENIGHEQIFSAFDTFVQDELGKSFKKVSKTEFKVLGTKTDLHHQTIIDLNNKMKSQILKSVNENLYAYHSENVAKMLNNAFEIVSEYTDIIEKDGYEDISFSASYKHSSLQELPPSVIEKQVRFLEHYKNTLEQNKKDLIAQLSHSRFHGNSTDPKQQQLYKKQFRVEKIKIERDIQQIDAILEGNNNKVGINKMLEDLQQPANQDTSALFLMMQQHLDRLELLLHPSKITILQNRNEAKEIFSFYNNVLNLHAENINVLFSQVDAKLLTEETKRDLESYRTKIADLSTKLFEFEVGIIQKALKDSPTVDANVVLNIGFGFSNDYKNYQRLKNSAKSLKPEELFFIKQFEEKYRPILTLQAGYSPEQLELAQLKVLYTRMFLGNNEDISFFSYLILDIGSSFEENAMIPQLMLSEITKVSDHYSMVLAGETEKLNELYKKAEKKLKFYKKTASIFKEVDKVTGKLTGKLITRFSPHYTSFVDFHKYATSRIYKKIEDAENKAREAFEWHNKNSLVVNLQSLPELRDIFSNPNTPNLNLIPKGMFKIDPNHVAKIKSLLGDEGYDNLIKEAIKNIEDFLTKKQAFILNLMLEYSDGNSVTLQDFLKTYPEAAQELQIFELKNPMIQHEFFTKGLPTQIDFNNLHTIPLESQEYNADFTLVEKDADLKAYYDQLVSVLHQIYNAKPYELQKTSHPLEIGAWEKSLNEVIKDYWQDIVNNPTKFFSLKTLLVLSEPFRRAFEKVVINNAYKHQGDKKVYKEDFITKARKKELNSATYFKNPKSDVHKDFKLLSIRLSAILRKYGALGNKTINKNTIIELEDAESILKELESYNPKLYNYVTIAMKQDASGNEREVEMLAIGKLLMDYVVDQHAQQQTDNINMAISYHYAQAMTYKSLKEVAPIIELLEKHYFHGNREGIGTRAETNRREFERYLNWKQRVLFEDFSKLDMQEESYEFFKRKGKDRNGILGTSYRFLSDILEKTKIKEETDTYYEKQKTYKTKQERARVKQLKQIKEQYDSKLTGREREALNKMFSETGAKFSHSVLGEKALLKFSRLVGLGYNYLSAMPNRSAAITVGMKYDSSGIFWTPGNFVKEQSTLRAASARFWTQGVIGKIPFTDSVKPLKDAKIARILVDRWQILQDVRNELQQTEQRKMAQSHFGMVLNPYDHIQRVEYMNQLGMVLAMMRDVKITGINGKETSLREAFEADGKLKREFRTPENIKNWENSSFELSGNVEQDMQDRAEFLKFKQKTIECLKTLHGDYTKHGGNVLKSTVLGNMFMMFKGWSQRNFHQRMHKRTFSVPLGRETEGYYASHTKTTVALQGALTGLKYAAVGTGAILLPGLWGVVPTTLIAAGLARAYMKKKKGKNLNLKDALLNIKKENSQEASLVTDMFIVGKLVAAQFVGIPLNFVTSHNIIDANKVASNNELKRHGLDKVQAENLRMIASSIAVQLNLLALQVAVMLLLSGGSDDEEEEKKKEADLADEIAMKYMSKQQRESFKALKKIEKDQAEAKEIEITNQAVIRTIFTDKLAIRNFLMNSLMSTNTEVAMYGDPVEVVKFYGERPISIINTVINGCDAFFKFYNYLVHPELDRDVVNKTSKFITSVSKLTPMPVKVFMTNKYAKTEDIFENNLFETLDPEVVKKYEKKAEKGQRSIFKEELLNEGIPPSQVDSIVNATYPTQTMVENERKRAILKSHSEAIKQQKKNSKKSSFGSGGLDSGGLGGGLGGGLDSDGL